MEKYKTYQICIRWGRIEECEKCDDNEIYKKWEFNWIETEEEQFNNTIHLSNKKFNPICSIYIYGTGKYEKIQKKFKVLKYNFECVQ